MAYTTIDDPSAYFQIATYTGNVTNRTITNDGNSDLQPDWIWFKNRNTTNDHEVFDSTRGKTRRLRVNSTAADDDSDTRVRNFNTDGFDCGTDPSANGDGNEMVAWQWKANGGSLTTAAESGSNVGYSRQVNTTSGFAIIKYTGIGSGAAVIHGMSATPSFFTVKRLTGSGYSWYTYHHKNTLYPHTDNLYLNNTDGTVDSDTVWNDQSPTSTEIKLGTNTGVNSDGVEYIMYAFAEKQGYSKFGSFTGSNDADGPFVYTGFKPAFVIAKISSATSDWIIIDNKRSPSNLANKRLRPNKSNAEDTAVDFADFLSNGFKIRHSGDFNASGVTTIYIAFAEHPFVSSEGVPTTAR